MDKGDLAVACLGEQSAYTKVPPVGTDAPNHANLLVQGWPT